MLSLEFSLTKKTNSRLMMALAAAALLAFSEAGRSQTVTYSSTIPTPGASDAFNLPGDPNAVTYAVFGTNYPSSSPGDYYSNNTATAVASQSFTTGSNTQGYSLTGIDLGIAEKSTTPADNSVGDTNDKLVIGTLNGSTFTQIYTASFTMTPVANAYGEFEEFTLSSTANVTLAANTTYAFGVINTAGGYQPYALDSSASYSGGTAGTLNTTTGTFSTLTSTGSGTGTGNALDAIFDVNMTAVAAPEPSTYALLGLGGLGLLALRRIRRPLADA